MKPKRPQNLEINITKTNEIDSITESQIGLIDKLMAGCKDTGKNVIVSCVSTDFNKTGKNRLVIAEPRVKGYNLFYSDGTTTTRDVDGILCGCKTRDEVYKCMSILRGVKTEDGFESRLQKARDFVSAQK